MSEGSASSLKAHALSQTTTLHVISPSINRLTFAGIPTSTTVNQLKKEIENQAETHPAPSSQRLIVRGHVLIREDATLKDIFTQEAIDGGQGLTLHLVVPPVTAPQSSTHHPQVPHQHTHPLHPQQQNMLPQQVNPQIVDGSPDSGSSPSSAQQGNHMRQATTGQSFIPQPQTQQDANAIVQMPQGQIPPQIQQAFAQMHAANAQLAAQLAAFNHHPALQGVQPHQPQIRTAQPVQAQFFPQSFQNWPQIIAQQQQARAAAGQHGVASGQQPNIQQNGAPPNPSTAVVNNGANQSPGQTPHSSQGNRGTVVRENVGPNGERFQMVIQSGTMNFNASNNYHAPHGPYAPTMNPNRPSSAPPTNQINMPNQNRGTSGLANEAPQLSQATTNHLLRAGQERQTAQRLSHGAESSAVYVLSSPAGPHALLVSPSGLHASSWQIPTLRSPPSFSPTTQHQTNIAGQPQQGPQNHMANAQQAQFDAPQAQHQAPQQADVANVAQAHQQRQENQARRLARILLPLGGHLWLFIRLFGFVYFFTHGASWTRTILLALVALIVFIVQSDVFRPLAQGIWDPIRRHAEGILPLAGHEPQRRGNAEAGVIANAGDVQRRNGDPTPQQAAERLLQERERQDVNIIRQSFRRVERAIALFVASLIPGVGERHIAAREATEAVRETEAREREERMRREEEQARQEQAGNAGCSDERSGTNVAANGELGESSAASGPAQPAQPPLVDV